MIGHMSDQHIMSASQRAGFHIHDKGQCEQTCLSVEHLNGGRCRIAVLLQNNIIKSNAGRVRELSIPKAVKGAESQTIQALDSSDVAAC